MKALILKDLLTMKKYYRSIGLFMAVYFVFALVSRNGGFVSGVCVIFSIMVAVTSFHYDSEANWEPYALCLPVTRNRMVDAKYVLALSMGAAGAVIGMITGAAVMLLTEKTIRPDEIFGSAGALLMVALYMSAILLPMIYRWGVEKSRLMMILVAMVPAALVFLIVNSGIPMPSETTIKILIIAAAVFSVLLFFGSWLLSRRIFAKKEL